LIAFELNDLRIRFVLPLPSHSDPAIIKTPTGKPRSKSQVNSEYEKAVKQKWRALSLVIKAKLEAVDSGITVFEDEFMAHIVLPNNSTVGDFMRPQIKQAYDEGKMPKMLPMIAAPK